MKKAKNAKKKVSAPKKAATKKVPKVEKSVVNEVQLAQSTAPPVVEKPYEAPPTLSLPPPQDLHLGWKIAGPVLMLIAIVILIVFLIKDSSSILTFIYGAVLLILGAIISFFAYKK